MATLATNFTSCSAENVNVLSWAEGEPCFGVKWKHDLKNCLGMFSSFCLTKGRRKRVICDTKDFWTDTED